ncbi:uncharacterized protein PHALS_15415 [Plasmopara halstedii]|uniref:Uncharacterized protein n=1 Tax=Plasmopara halstedii TaxID=4781 RepID=A0A0P1AG00_PLAHL|nr:uncharacterized protein PHALS_15415 [Plasmopara halstedii]CEG39966.1 hypothetical protein PHALS_15415 [Plasmopara halstedii]|eukprot:XP_024576335.1 hypothetical protein PHALS_15415 [Plasmopara halstedii]
MIADLLTATEILIRAGLYRPPSYATCSNATPAPTQSTIAAAFIAYVCSYHNCSGAQTLVYVTATTTHIPTTNETVPKSGSITDDVRRHQFEVKRQ